MSDINGIQNPFNQVSQQNTQTSSVGTMTGGSINGVAVDAPDIEKSLFEDSMEEMTFAKDNSKQTKLSLRKQKNAEQRLAELLKKMQTAIMQKVNAKAQIDDIVERASRAGCSPQDIIKGFRGYEWHDAESYAILNQLAEEESDPARATLFKHAAELLYSDNKSSITAVVNAMDVTEDNFAGFSPIENAENYSDALINFQDEFSMFSFILDKYGDKFEDGLDFINKALAADLEAAQASHEPEFFKSVSDGLSQAKVLYSCFAHEDLLLSRLDEVVGVDVKDFNKTDFVKKFNDLLIKPFIDSTDIRGLLGSIKAKDPEQEVLICQELSRSLHNFSDMAFKTNEIRERVNNACAMLIDEKIALEDEWLQTQQ